MSSQHWFRVVLVMVCSTVLFCGCRSTPSFRLGANINDSPTVTDLVKHIECEIYWAEGASWADPKDGKPVAMRQKLHKDQYVAFAQLTLDVTNFQGTAPQLNYINPYLVPMTNFTATVGGQYTGTQHRNMTQSFSIDISRERTSTAQNDCGAEKDEKVAGSSPLKGDLGLEAIIRDGLARADSTDFPAFPLAKGSGSLAGNLAATTAPVFGSTVDFTIVYGVNGVGPNWTIMHFKGPGGGTGGGGGGGGSSGATSGGASGGSAQGLLTLTRTLKDTLVISFAPAAPQTEPGVAAAKPAITLIDPDLLAQQLQVESDVDRQITSTIRQLTDKVNSLRLSPRASNEEKTNLATTQALAASSTMLSQTVLDMNRRQMIMQAQLTQAVQSLAVAPDPTAAAVRAAQDNNTRMILQNLLNP